MALVPLSLYRYTRLMVLGAIDAIVDLFCKGRREYKWQQRLDDLLCHRGVSLPSPGSWAVVTGANSGIGFELSFILASAGVNVLLACRNESRGLAAETRLRSTLPEKGEHGKPCGRVEYANLDVSDLSSVAKFAKSMTERRISIIVCNAALSATPWMLGPQGYEAQFTANHLGHSLLCQLLLPQMRSCTPARIVTVTSSSASWSITKFRSDLFAKDMKEPTGHDRFAFYGETKAMQLCCALEFADRLDKDVVAHALHPGCASTNIVNAWPAARLMAELAKPFQITAKEAASYVARLCLASDAAPEAGKGKYYHCGYVAKPGPVASQPDNRKRAWELTQELLKREGWLSS